MKRGIPISTAGTQVCWAVETVAGTMPTAAKLIPDIKEIPDLNPQPEMLETTDLSCTETKTFIPGLKDLSNASSYTANFTFLLKKEWAKLVEASATAEADGKATWFFIQLKNGDTVAFTGKPTQLGLPGAGVNSVVEINCYITPTSEPKWIEETITFTEPTDE